MVETPLDIVRKQEQNYITSDTTISEHVTFSVKENVDKIEAYLNSKHISGDKDSLGREKPFFNIVTAACNVWYRATDIDRANIRIKAAKSAHHVTAMLADVKSKEWMRKSGFGVWLNDWGRTLSRYGSAVSKFVEKDGELVATVVPWNRLIVDDIDFYANPVIEKHYYTGSQLRKNKNFDQGQVESLILSSKQSRETIGGDKADSKNEYIEVYELHGEFPMSMLNEDGDEDDYAQMVFICSFTVSENGDYNDYILYSGKEKNPYHIAHLIKEEGRVIGRGAVEHLFEAQWMVNHNEKAIKDQLELASKLIFQTSDPAYQGKNTGNLDTGSILFHEPNQPLTQLANNSHDIASLMNDKMAWINQGSEVTSAQDAIKGNTMPSGTAARQVEALQQESHSLFELMTETKGLALEEVWRTFVIPHIKKNLDNKDEIVAALDDMNIKQIDAIYLPNQAKKIENERIKKQMFKLAASGLDENVPFPEPADIEGTQAGLVEELQQMGNQRYFKPSEMDDKTWKELFKDFEWGVEVEVTNEQTDKLANLTTLTTVLAQLAGMGDIENARMVLSKILEETGTFSPMELVAVAKAPMPLPPGTPSPAQPEQMLPQGTP
jgi:hypothetical protein